MFTKRDENLEKQEPLWHEETVANAEKILDTDLVSGLTADDARERMSSFGPNRLEASGRPSNLKIFLSQFNDFFIWVLLVTAITAILILNALLGFKQEVVIISG